MKYINPPSKAPANIFHKTFYSRSFGHELGYNIYLPENYEAGKNYPVHYHLHGWTNDESTDIWTMKDICRSRRAITVFPNNSPVIEDREDLPVEEMIIHELIPHIDSTYQTSTSREHRSISGFSMGGGMAFYLAAKYPELFSSVTAYAGTYHHYYHKDYATVGSDPQRASEIYRAMIQENKPFEKSILQLVTKNADQLRDRLAISLHVGTVDVLYCDNEILRLHLESLHIPHEYQTFRGASHRLCDIL